MTLSTNTRNRKVLAEALSRLLGESYHYLGAPTMAYQVGGYTIHRDGHIEGDDFEAIRGFLAENGYIHEPDEAQSMDAPTPAQSTDGLSVSIPMGDLTPLALTCLLRTLYARQALINAMTRSDCLAIDEELVSRLAEEKPETNEQIQELLQGEIDAGCVRGFRIEEEKLSMDFPFDAHNPIQWQAFADLLMQLEKHACAARHVTAKKITPTESEMKYFCRSWLMQLGFAGSEHRDSRAALLNHLPGYAAFRTADKMDAHKARTIARRREARQAQAQAEPDSKAADSANTCGEVAGHD